MGKMGFSVDHGNCLLAYIRFGLSRFVLLRKESGKIKKPKTVQRNRGRGDERCESGKKVGCM